MARGWHCAPPMLLSRSALAVFAISAAALAAGCDPTLPVDLNFDSSLGADFVPPPADAGLGGSASATAGDGGGGSGGGGTGGGGG